MTDWSQAPGIVSAPGTCIVKTSVLTDHSIRLTVERADPRIWVTAEFLAMLKAGVPTRADGRPYAEIDGDLLRINADNRTVVYRLGEHHLEMDVYEAEWPD